MPTLFTHQPHPYIRERREEGPVKVQEQWRTDSAWHRLNAKVGLTIIIAWVSSNFLQLVLLPIIIVGQNIQAKAADKRAEATYNDADAVLHEALQIQKHLEAQDGAIENILTTVGGPPPATPPAAG